MVGLAAALCGGGEAVADVVVGVGELVQGPGVQVGEAAGGAGDLTAVIAGVGPESRILTGGFLGDANEKCQATVLPLSGWRGLVRFGCERLRRIRPARWR